MANKQPMVILSAIAIFLSGGCIKQKGPANLYDIQVETITGDTITMGQYRGKVLLIVNTASQCGFTGQYEGLQKLYDKYSDQGLVVLGFPCNDFQGQEPGTEAEILSFCSVKYGVTFPLSAKIAVQGDKQHDLYRLLTDTATNPKFGGKITWNFNKFLIGRDGTILARFDSRTEPQDEKLISVLEEALKKSS